MFPITSTDDDDDDDDDSRPSATTPKPAGLAAQSVDYAASEYPATGQSTGEQSEDPVYPDEADSHTVTLLSSPPEASDLPAAGNAANGPATNSLAANDDAEDDDDDDDDEDDDDESDDVVKRSREWDSDPQVIALS